jgi:hypothetical protein
MKKILVLANYDSPHLAPWIPIYESLVQFIFVFISNKYTSRNENFKCLNMSNTSNPFIIKSLIKKQNIDLIHTHSGGKLGVISLFLNTPYVLRIYGTELFATEHSYIRRVIMNVVLKKASRVGSSSKYTKEFIKTHYPKFSDKVGFYSFPASTIFTKLQYTLKEKASVLTKHKKDINFTYLTKVFFINRRVGQLYNTNNVVLAFKDYLKIQPDSYLIIMNSFTIDQEHLNLVKLSVGLDESSFIFINKPIDAFELNELYNSSDLFISIPSTDQLSLSIMEGIKAGCLPLLSDTKSYQFLIQKYNFPSIKLDAEKQANLLSIFNNINELDFNFSKFNNDFDNYPRLILELGSHFNKAFR